MAEKDLTNMFDATESSQLVVLFLFRNYIASFCKHSSFVFRNKRLMSYAAKVEASIASSAAESAPRHGACVG